MPKSRIQKLRDSFDKNPSRLFDEALPYILRQIEHLSHLKPKTRISKRVTKATLDAAILLEEAEHRLHINTR